jgi:hypothetical protein
MPVTVEPPDIVTYQRGHFLSEIWDYKPGEMVTVLCPYGGGKTELAFQLLQQTCTPKMPACVFVMKAKDETVSRYVKAMGLLIERDWPPPKLRRWIWHTKPRGWALWPTETEDTDADDARHTQIFRRALRERYRHGPDIVFADETYSLEKELGLERDLRRVWTKGRSMKCGLWAASQRPVYISRWALQAHHLFLGYDPDVDMQKRYSEIGGGVDPEIVRWIVARLQKFEFLYINRDDRTMCIVSA